MHKQIFVNLAVADLPRARTFFEALGLHFNPQFSNDKGACLVISEHIYVMLLTQDFFRTFTDKTLCDPHQSTEALLCLSCETRAEVDTVIAKARAAGGAVPRTPQDHGFMYIHGFQDLDGHLWELAYIDPNAAPPA